MTGAPVVNGTVGILVVDDHPLLRRGLTGLLEGVPGLSVVAEAVGVAAALAAIEAHRPDLAVVDLRLGDGDGLELIAQVWATWKLPVVVLTMYDTPDVAERALRAGARGFVRKTAVADRVVEAIQRVHAGEIYLCEAVRTAVLERLASPTEAAAGPLTPRETEVFRLYGRGESTRRIAGDLGVSMRTVETHRASIKRKLGLADANALVRAAVEWALGGERSTPGT